MRAVILLGVMAAAACDSPTSSTNLPNVQTGSSTYSVEPSSIGRRIAIDIHYTNTLPKTVDIGHCGGVPAVLYKRIGSDWEIAGSVGALDCGGSTAVVGPGESYRRTLHFEGAPSGSNIYPQFEFDDLAGVYRVVLTEVVVDRSETAIGTVIPERLRTSNTFQVVNQRPEVGVP